MQGGPPLLTRRLLAARLKALRPAWPLELIRAAERELLMALTEALAAGRPVALNGFGRLTRRLYRGPRKKFGLLFRPSSRLRNRLAGAGAAGTGATGTGVAGTGVAGTGVAGTQINPPVRGACVTIPPCGPPSKTPSTAR